MTGSPGASDSAKLIREVLERIRTQATFQQLEANGQRAVERGIEKRLKSLTSPHNALTGVARENEIRWYVNEGALAFLEDMWNWQTEMRDYLAWSKAEREAREESGRT
jgi:hypothetical protein